MRLFILSTFLLLSANGMAQTAVTDTTAVPQTARWEAGKTYVDSVEMDMSKTYLDPHNIRSVVKLPVDENKIYSGNNQGAILITRKKKQDFASPGDLKPEQQKGTPPLPVVYMINEKLIEDTTGVRFEATAIDSVHLLKDVNPGQFHRTQQITVLIKMKKTYK